MSFKKLFTFYFLLFTLWLIFSYGFVDPNFPLKSVFYFNHLYFQQRLFSTIIYLFLVVGLFFGYGLVLFQIKKKRLLARQLWQLIFMAGAVLFFSYPAFSCDIFNYMATAKVAYFYKENPYLLMPIEFIGEPMLEFMHASNKVALYAPFWIFLTAIPHFLGAGKIFLSLFTFKAFILIFYFGLIWLVWLLSGKNSFSLGFFALNPLVLIEILISAHNDVVMMFFALLGLRLLWQKKKIWSLVSLLASVGIKYATVFLIPFFAFSSRFKKEKLIIYCVGAMFLAFLFSPLREEIYSWYFIWVLVFIALLTEKRLLFWLAVSFSLGLLLRYTPWLYFRSWGGITPLLKTLTTFIPPLMVMLVFLFGRFFSPKNYG